MTDKTPADQTQKTDEDAERRRAGAIGVSLLLAILSLGGLLLLAVVLFGWRLRRRIQRGPASCATATDPLWYLRHGTNESHQADTENDAESP
ncbi:MAG: hypothetical protein O3A00_02765 [Planctomycetota bacterium]|nr:hypothetical protein [Planctomycetota bacterium]